MGYTTKFSGVIELSRPLTLAEAKLLLEIASDDREVDTFELFGEEHPVPDSYLQWVPTADLTGIVWDGNEKFYFYTEWMRCICALLAKWGVEACGELRWRGEDVEDVGTLIVEANEVTENKGTAENRAKSRDPLTLKRLGEIALERATANA